MSYGCIPIVTNAFALPEVVNLENRLRFEISEVKQLGRDLRINLRPGRRET